jgi:hypothetical protein
VLSAYQAAAIALCLASSAFAQAPRQVRFEYERQDGATACPDLATVQAGVAARLGYEPFDDHADDLLRATIHQSGHGLEARIQMIDANGSLKAERKLVSHQRDCAELASSVELAVSIAIDPFRLAPSLPGQESGGNVLGQPKPQVASQGQEHDPPRPAVRSTIEPASASKPRRPISGRVEAGIVGGIGAAPSRTIGVAAGGGIRDGDLSFGIEGRADLPASASLRVGEASASTSLLVASLVPCLHFRMVAACALATAGALRAAGHHLVDSRQVTLPYLALGARLAVEIPVTTRLSLGIHGDLTTPLTETELQVDGASVWTSPILSVALGIGVAATFP